MSQLSVESVKDLAFGLWNKAEEFTYELDVTPLAHTTTPLWVVPTYLAMVYGTRYYVRNIRKKPFDLNLWVIIHNWVLSIGSGVLFALLAYDLVADVQKFGMFDVYCDPGYKHNNGRRFLWYYVNYIFKYVELIDTLLLALRDKPMIFLHVYHHAATLVLCWSQMNARSCVQWIPISVNLLIHVIMYSYYALHAMGKDVWWKKYLTTAQIIQFVIVLCLITPPLAFKIIHDYVGVEIVPDCNGSYGWSFFGVGIIASYLLLFLDLYSVKYTKPGGKKDKGAKVAPAGAEKENGSKNGDVPMQSMAQSNVARRTGTKAH